MQFLQQHRYIAVAIGGEVNFYGKPPLLNAGKSSSQAGDR